MKNWIAQGIAASLPNRVIYFAAIRLGEYVSDNEEGTMKLVPYLNKYKMPHATYSCALNKYKDGVRL